MVWRLTTDVARWPSFMPTVQRVTLRDPEPLRVGGRARVKQPGQSAAVWTLTDVRDRSGPIPVAHSGAEKYILF